MRGSVRSAFDDQPLAMGAAALGLGLAGGLALPSSRGEDRMMGDASDTVKDEAGDVASDVAKQAGEAAKQIAESPSDESRE